MEKRAESGNNNQVAGPTKKIKTESASDDALLRLSPGHPSPSPMPAPGSDPSVTTASPSLSNFDKLVSLAAQRSDAANGASLSNQNDAAPLNLPSQTVPSPTASSLPLSLQRLQAMRQQQQQQQKQQEVQHSATQMSNSLPSAPQTSNANLSSTSYDQLIDVMGYSGVDLRAEEAFIQQNGSSWEDSHTASAIHAAGLVHGLYLNVYPLSNMVHRIARQYGLSVNAATLDYLSIATRMRFRNLLESMVRASRHRAWSTHQRSPPMYLETLPDGSRKAMYHEELISNPVKQLAGIEKAERIEEGNWRRMRIEREENEAAALEAGGDDGTPKGKKRTGTSSRNLSEDVRKRLADSTAMRHLGANNMASKYSWLQSPSTRTTASARVRDTTEPTSASNSPAPKANSALPKPKFAPSANRRGTAAQAAHAGAWSDVALRQAAQREQERVARSRVTLHDALSALEREHAGGAGSGAGRRVLYMAQAYGSGRCSL